MSASATPCDLSALRIAAIRALAARRARAEVGARRRTPAWKSAMSGTSVAVPFPSTAIVGVVSVVCAAAGAASSSVAASAANSVLMPLLRSGRECVTRGESHRDAQTPGGPRGEGEGPVVGVGDALDDGQPETDARVVGAYALGAALKRLGQRGDPPWAERLP